MRATSAKPRATMGNALQRLQRAIGNLRMQQLVRAHRQDPLEIEADRAAAGEAVRDRVDSSEVRIHDDAEAHRIADGLHANAVTRGNDIYFREGAYDPQSEEGSRLLAHELTHVAQQRGEAAGRAQCDLLKTEDAGLGGFAIAMEKREEPPGMEGTIRFEPHRDAPYSAEIGMIQNVNVTDIGGKSTQASGLPFDWSPFRERARMDLMTPAGWHVDVLTRNMDRASQRGPNYVEREDVNPPNSVLGYVRSPDDIQAASLYDYPKTRNDWDFDFETVAKATDTQAIYGALNWGFGMRSGEVVDEYAYALPQKSPEFDEALERYRGYYTHEEVVLYFDTNVDTPYAGEEAKLTDFLDYLNRYPDALLQLEGYADERGTDEENEDLSLRRAINVQKLLIGLGVDPSRIDDTILGSGRTFEFAAGRTPGQLLANRRVVIKFVRTANVPIVMP